MIDRETIKRIGLHGSPQHLVALLEAVARAAHYALDNAEVREGGGEGTQMIIDYRYFQPLVEALDACDMIEEIDDEYIRDGYKVVADRLLDSVSGLFAEWSKGAEPVAWIDSSGHPSHLRAIQSFAEEKLYGKRRPLFARPQPAIPPGWRLVPEEPTDEMHEAGLREWNDVGSNCDSCYCAMLQAAPEATK